jgi:hypothetical protein
MVGRFLATPDEKGIRTGDNVYMTQTGAITGKPAHLGQQPVGLCVDDRGHGTGTITVRLSDGQGWLLPSQQFIEVIEVTNLDTMAASIAALSNED